MMMAELNGGEIGRGASRSAARIVSSGGSWMVGARLVRTMITVLGMISLARLLTPADFGVVAITTTVTVLSLVIIEGAIDFPALRHDGLTRDAVQSMIWTALIFIVPFGGVLYVAAPFVEVALNFPQLSGALRGILPIFVLQVFFIAGTALLRRQHRFRAAAVISVGSILVYITLAVLFAALGWGLWSIIIAQNISMALTAIILASQTAISLRWPRTFSLSAVGRVGAYGAGARILAWFWTSIDTIAVAATLGPAAAGLYTRAYNINVQIKEPFSALDGVTRQALVAVRNRDGHVAAHAVMMLRLFTLATSSSAAVCAVLREPIVMVLLGSQWQASAPVFAILVIGLPARIALTFFDGLASTAGSMSNMVVRHGIMCAIVGIGVWQAAPYGSAAVASVVSGALYVAILLPVRRSERLLTGSRSGLLVAMLPGLGLGTGLLVLGEYALMPLAKGNWFAAFAVVLPVSGLIVLLVAGLLPGRWLPPALYKRRRSFLRQRGSGSSRLRYGMNVEKSGTGVSR